MSYKIVFQGGGAKLFPLISAVEAIQKQIDDDQNFSVSTVAGASAGAIAAMILAAGVDCEKLREHFRTKAGKHAVMSAFPAPSRMSVLKCLLIGKTLFDRSKLEELLYKILEIGGYSEKKSTITLKSKLVIAITDLKKSSVHFSEIETSSVENIVKNVADSCSIPFVFKNHNSRYNWEFVDGGLFENFPVSSLASSVDDTRKILGFSFEEEAAVPNGEKPTLLMYLKVLVSTAIDANISASLRLLGDENVFTIKTEISTLDFKDGLDQFVSIENRLESVRSNIASWIESVVKREKQIDASIDLSDTAIVPTSFSTFSEFAAKLYEARKRELLQVSEALSYFQVNSIYSEAAPNRSKFEYLYRRYVYEVPDDGLECIMNWTSYMSTIDVEKYSDFLAFDDQGNKIGFTLLPVSGGEIPEDYVALAMFFDRKIVKSESESITVVMKQFIPDCLATLTEKGIGHLVVGSPPGAKTEKLLLFVGMPQEFAHLYRIEVLGDCRDVVGEELQAVSGKITDDIALVGEVKAGGTQITGFEADGPVGKGQALGLRLEKNSIVVGES
ncbi:patatin-like phospholipase family protein [uncultured Ruegeria sp.]|uniref:patatin-like phospholipase family protein n=1 Tax=uncultured Ruegeria sp. TaxID=259304 RepID=UPI00260947E9|nr:patatin-like phospholipase family protein [uncultured Ruegeria sp.]